LPGRFDIWRRGGPALHWLFQRGEETFGVRTKGVDRVVSPHISAVEKGRAGETLLKAGVASTR
jgi:hypothetical protein